MKNIVDTISIVARMDPNRAAVVYGNMVLSYRDLDARIRMSESWLTNEALRDWNVGEASYRSIGSPSHEKIVMVAAEHPVDFIVCLLSSLDVGLTVLAVPPRTSSQTRIEMIRKLHIGRVLRYAAYGGKEQERPAFQFGKLLDVTSGSYGAKKLVVRSSENLNDEAGAIADRLNLHMGKRVFVTTPLAHSFGGGIMRAVFISGATLYVSAAPEMYNKLVDIRDNIHHADIVTGVPYIFHSLLRHWKGELRPEVRCYAGGEVVSKRLIYDWQWTTGSQLFQEYGLSEGGIVSFGSMFDPADSIGPTLRGVAIQLDDDEIVVYRTWAPTHYYFGESSKTFQADGGIRTGDLGRRENGYYFITGRKKSVIIVAGMKVVPAEVEKALTEHTDIDEAVVFGIPDAQRGEEPVAVVTARRGNVDLSGVRRYMRSRLDTYKVPRDIYVMKELPRTESGKVDRVRLKEAMKGG